ncbi:MAG: bifunctional folylpolyglutamate synthase/dihydrofolate synthase [candidate division Zixibacteria bacterium]|nr:bifunctional folylpolyglutamate synthase/dihydrofolate synthase [candidate division Zixibacteria bacterium]
MRKHTDVSAERFILSREFFGMKLGLKNIGEFLESIGSPQQQYPTIHIAGTNGKGSTAAMLAAILRAEGYKTGLFTSPHLITLRERVRVNGRMISKPSLTGFVNRHRRELTRRQLSFFEVVTAMAFDYFRRAKVDVAVIETGLGGRLDATNTLQPILTLTTEISRDHVEILGQSLPKIAREKAGIIKSRVPHLIGHLPDSAEKVIRDTCRKREAPLQKLLLKDYRLYPNEMAFTYTGNGLAGKKLTTSLPGVHQLKNAALAVKAIAVLKGQNMAVSGEAVRDGLLQTDWPGRFQIIRRRGHPTVILDVAHNTTGVRAFVDSFRLVFPDRKAKVITGFVKRKEHQKMLDSLALIAEEYLVVPLRSRRGTDVKALMAEINWREIPHRSIGSLVTACRRVRKLCQSDDIIVVIGSHFLVGEYLDKNGLI